MKALHSHSYDLIHRTHVWLFRQLQFTQHQCEAFLRTSSQKPIKYINCRPHRDPGGWVNAGKSARCGVWIEEEFDDGFDWIGGIRGCLPRGFVCLVNWTTNLRHVLFLSRDYAHLAAGYQRKFKVACRTITKTCVKFGQERGLCLCLSLSKVPTAMGLSRYVFRKTPQSMSSQSAA